MVDPDMVLAGETLPAQACAKGLIKAIKWGNLLAVSVAVFDYLVYSAISLIGTFFPTQVRL